MYGRFLRVFLVESESKLHVVQPGELLETMILATLFMEIALQFDDVDYALHLAEDNQVVGRPKPDRIDPVDTPESRRRANEDRR